MSNINWPLRLRANVNLNVRAQPRLSAGIVEKALRGSFLIAEDIETGDAVKGDPRWYRVPASGSMPLRYFWAGGVSVVEEVPVPRGGNEEDSARPEFLTAHFSLQELTASQTASRRGIDNTPNATIRQNLQRLALMLEEVRSALGDTSIRISSGYRCRALNTAIGGASQSKHMSGLAADFTAPRFGSVLETARAIEKSGIRYDQLIYEYRSWVHISVAPEGSTPREEELSIFTGGPYRPGILER